MSDATHVIAGRCTTVSDGIRTKEQHGDVLELDNLGQILRYYYP